MSFAIDDYFTIFKNPNELFVENDIDLDNLESSISKRYSFTNENGPYGHCTILCHNGSVVNCFYKDGLLDGYFVATRYEELECVKILKEGNVVQDVDLSQVHHYQIADLPSDQEGCWEGDVLNGIPYGWGEVVDSTNRLLYCGFRIGNVNVCYGTSYNPQTSTIEYQGHWCFGKRWGSGSIYLPTGEKHEQEWLNNQLTYYSTATFSNNVSTLFGIHSLIQELRIGDDSCVDSVCFRMECYCALQSIKLGREAFANCRKCFLCHLPKLESIEMGDHSLENIDHVAIKSI